MCVCERASERPGEARFVRNPTLAPIQILGSASCVRVCVCVCVFVCACVFVCV